MAYLVYIMVICYNSDALSAEGESAPNQKWTYFILGRKHSCGWRFGWALVSECP